MSLLDSFIVNSDYPADKIVWTAEGTADSSNPYWEDVFGGVVLEPIPDSLDWRTILIDGVWTNDNWETQYPINTNSRVMGYINNGSGSYTVEFDEVDIDIMPKVQILSFRFEYQCAMISGRAYGGRTLKYRLWAYVMESDWNSYSDMKTAETLASKLQLNTDLAQLNMISETVISVPSGQTRTLHHNLGFRPYCKIWRKSDAIVLSGEDAWNINNLYTVFNPNNQYRLNKITIDEEKVTIYAEDAYNGDDQNFLIRIYNYAIPL